MARGRPSNLGVPWIAWALGVAFVLAACGERTVHLTRDAGPDAPLPPDAPAPVGCADGARDGFVDIDRFPQLAGCAGGFDVPGVTSADSRAPRCARRAGDDGGAPDGRGCSVADLCAEGWHVCDSAAEVGARLPPGATCREVLPGSAVPAFFATRQASPGFGRCGPGDDGVFGCGTVGDVPDLASCAPLDRFGENSCRGLPSPWSCREVGTGEALTVVKPGAGGGGVLCCAD